jgi:hypothetical protein
MSPQTKAFLGNHTVAITWWPQQTRKQQLHWLRGFMFATKTGSICYKQDKLAKHQLECSLCKLLLSEAGRWGCWHFSNPEEGRRPPLEAVTKQREWRLDCRYQCGCVRVCICVCVCVWTVNCSLSVYHSVQYIQFSIKISSTITLNRVAMLIARRITRRFIRNWSCIKWGSLNHSLCEKHNGIWSISLIYCALCTELVSDRFMFMKISIRMKQTMKQGFR